MEVILLGKGKGWRDAPTDIETWGITQQLTDRPISRIIDMNDYSLWDKLEQKRDVASRKRAIELGIPYYDLETFPLQEIVDYFGIDYFSSTVDYALALAIYENYKTIHLWGINMEMESEYAHQTPGGNFWCGMAMGKGAKVVKHGIWSTLMRNSDGKLYGYGMDQKY